MISFQSINEGLMGFYIIVALVLLTIAIVTYPSLRDRSKRSK